MAINVLCDSPQHASIDAFLDECIAGDTEEFTLRDAQLIAIATNSTIKDVARELKELGLKLRLNESARNQVRGFTTNPHGNRWGECPSHGGSGWEQIGGFAGQEG